MLKMNTLLPEARIYFKDQDTSNMYLVFVSENSALIFDPSFISKAMEEYIEKEKIVIEGLFLTHGHFDHLKAASYYQNKYHCPLYLHQDDVLLSQDPYKNCSVYLNENVVLEADVTSLYDEQEFNFPLASLKVIHTPFHTAGSCCFLIKEQHLLISGDTLFYRTIGRSDLPSSSPKSIRSSLDKLRKLDKIEPYLKVYPGHGKTTTLQDEIQFNHYFNE